MQRCCFLFMADIKTKQRFALVALLAGILLGYPLLNVVNRNLMFAGIPVLFAWIFIVWLLLIILLWILAEKKLPDQKPNHE